MEPYPHKYKHQHPIVRENMNWREQLFHTVMPGMGGVKNDRRSPVMQDGEEHAIKAMVRDSFWECAPWL